MKFTPCGLRDACVVALEPIEDERGFFARTFCVHEFKAHGLESMVAQANVSFSHRMGTLRGLHYQVAPATETKLVRCTRGAIYDVIVDLDPTSPTYCRHFAIELTAQDRRAVYIPPMFAHGSLTLADDTELSYHVGAFYAPEHERGCRYDDPAFNIAWPAPVEVISDKDASWPPFERSGS